MDTHANTKQAARRLIARLPDGATWDEIAYQVETMASIERGLAESAVDRFISHAEIKREFAVGALYNRVSESSAVKKREDVK